MGNTESEILIKDFCSFYDLENPERLINFPPKTLMEIFSGLLLGIDIIDWLCANNYYSADEVAEFIDGAYKNIDYTIYALVEYNIDGLQMRMVKEGILENIDYTLYSNPKYDWKHMYYIKKGLEEQIDVSRYLDPNLSIMEIIKIRKELKNEVGSSYSV